MSDRSEKAVRCAIYTRVSTDERLDQSFNSLDAQREACAAYVLSQQHEGWVSDSEAYDDGGFSGGTMDRPALVRLLQDIRAGRIDTIVVYKIDRLTRSLADFARIVDVLDSSGASFVSVTQSFNTQTSMGRLTLNVLLSFAQFERELTGERIRDKIAASKARGMWMGGVVPLGYDIQDRKLAVNAAEADRVRHIYRRYLDLGSVLALQAELNDQGITGKARATRGGGIEKGSSFSRGALYLLLQNRIYRGEICHKGTAYPGEHEPIVFAELFAQVQAQLERNRIDRSTTMRGNQPSLLIGLLWDKHGRPMTPNHCVKGKAVRYRYYVSRTTSPCNIPVWRVPAGDLEALVIGRLRAFLIDHNSIFEAADLGTADAATVRRTLGQYSSDGEALASQDPVKRRSVLTRIVDRLTLYDDSLELAISVDEEPATEDLEIGVRGLCAVLQISARVARVGKQMRLVLSRGPRPHRDAALVKLIVKSWQAREALESSEMTVAELAHNLSYDRQYLGVLLRVSYLAPVVVKAILAGQQPPTLTRQRLARVSRLPSDWAAQQQHLGFEAAQY